MLKKTQFIFLIFILFSCSLLQKTSEETENLLPRETEAPGWRIEIPPKTFTSDNIREYIKQPEEIRLLDIYGLIDLSTVKYKNISKPSIEITIEIFRMDSTLDAFGIFSMERAEGYKEENICEDSYSTSQALFSRKADYYTRIKSNIEYIDSIIDLNMLSKTICDKIKDIKPLPDYLSLFGSKKDGRMLLKYKKESLPEIPALKNIFIRKIEISGKIKTVFFAKRDSSYISVGEFSNLLKNKEKAFILSNAGELQIAFSKINDNEFIFISVFKECIFGVMDAENMFEGEKNLNYLYNDIIKYSKDSR